jgi:hypothetical protein
MWMADPIASTRAPRTVGLDREILVLRESIDILERSEYTRFLSEPLKAMIQFLEGRERFEEAVAFEERLDELRAAAVPEESLAWIA